MSSQVVRVQGFSKGSLSSIGNEAERGDVVHRNGDIDPARTHWNMPYKETKNGFYQEWKNINQKLNVQFRDTKNATAFEGMVITAEKKFFQERFGWEPDKRMSKDLTDFWDKCYSWAVQQVGYRGTEDNIISAIVHADETSLHLQMYYVPVTERWQEKVYAKDENGKVLRNKNGSPVQAKDPNGKTIYNIVEDPSAPKLSRTEFWRMRGGHLSYTQMQDRFHDEIGKQYGLERGEVGSTREHRTKNEWEREQLHVQKKELQSEVENYKSLKTEIEDVNGGRTIMPGVVAIKKKKLKTLQEQAKAYRTNRDEIENVREQSEALKIRALELNSREMAVNTKERVVDKKRWEAHELYERQIGLNEHCKKLETENSSLKAKITSLEGEKGVLRGEISKLREIIDNLKNKLKNAFNILRMSVKAVGMLKYDKNTGYKAELDARQEKIIDGVADLAAKECRENGFENYAEDITKHVGIEDEIRDYVQLDEKPKHKQWEIGE